MSLDVVIFAAGNGTRMRSSTPKVLHLLAGRPLLQHVVDSASQLLPRRICIVHAPGDARAVLERSIAGDNLQWVCQQRPEGTAHALGQALPELAAERVLVLCGDVPLIRPCTLERLIEASADAPLGILTALLDDPSGYGRILRDDTGRISRIVEDCDASEAQRRIREINTGVLLCDVRRLGQWLPGVGCDNRQGEYYLTDIVAMADNLASASPSCPSEIMGVNSMAQLAACERALQQRQAHELMARGLCIVDPARFDLRGTLAHGSDCRVDVNCVLEGRVVLGERVCIAPGCHLRNCSVGDDVVIKSGTILDDVEVGNRVNIGPYARLRPGTILGDEVGVGNFVEIKKSQLGRGTKVNHLAYMGDATLGADVNVGAGAISCNYDGRAKHRTIVGDGAFIGSNVSLVAPVSIGEGATLGAGSAISEDVEPGALALSRAQLLRKPGWRQKRKKTGGK